MTRKLSNQLLNEMFALSALVNGWCLCVSISVLSGLHGHLLSHVWPRAFLHLAGERGVLIMQKAKRPVNISLSGNDMNGTFCVRKHWATSTTVIYGTALWGWRSEDFGPSFVPQACSKVGSGNLHHSGSRFWLPVQRQVWECWAVISAS